MTVDDSILHTVKRACMIEADCETEFDSDLIMYTNNAFMTLHQLGVGPTEGFFVSSEKETWRDFLGSRKDLEGAKAYVCLKVKQAFDPPSTSFVLDSINNQLKELEWRLIAQVERSD